MKSDTFNVFLRAYWFRKEVTDLRRAYEAARQATERDQVGIEADYQQLQKDIAQGNASLTEEDENGQVIYDHGEHFGELLIEAETTLNIVREAFTISLHHFWERQIKKLMRSSSSYNEQSAFVFLKGLGLNPNEQSLTALRLAANVAKHSAGSSAEALFKIRPDLFDVLEMKQLKHPPSHEYLRLTDAVLSEFFEAVQRSGPSTRAG